MDKKQREILEFAVEKEKGANRFYADWADRAEDEEVRRLFRELAGDERKHADRLENATPDTLLEQPPAPPDFKISELLPEAKALETMSLADALTLAIRREERAIELYERLRRHSSPQGEALFAALADDERRHKHHLELRYARLARHGRP
ncbi:MAG: ferritin family protein [Candidatus Bipolaricaulota bacterium]|nr:MAG: ferritin family protein [Candidatus Bipolaricaulota bacterium]